MDLVAFLSHESLHSLGRVFCFVSKQNSLLITKIFKKKFEAISSNLKVIDTVESEAALSAQLTMGFLGQSSLFWLSEELLSENPITLSLLQAYSGPHFIGYIGKTVSKAAEITIEIPEELSYEQFMNIFAALYPQQSIKSSACAQQIFKISPTVSIQSALVLMHYCILVGNRSEVFLQSWLPSLLNPEKSLFLLSSLFFSRKEEQFFQLWALIYEDYSDPFWTTYWSEQLFKATLFCLLMHAKNFTQAKRVAYRLPFSFVQKDWKFFSSEELKQAHNHLYAIDWNIKNGLFAHFEHFFLHSMMKK